MFHSQPPVSSYGWVRRFHPEVGARHVCGTRPQGPCRSGKRLPWQRGLKNSVPVEPVKIFLSGQRAVPKSLSRWPSQAAIGKSHETALNQLAIMTTGSNFQRVMNFLPLQAAVLWIPGSQLAPSSQFSTIKSWGVRGASYSREPSVQCKTTTESPFKPNLPCSSAQTLLRPANVAAPQGPTLTPSPWSSKTARCASSSLTTTAASTPAWRVGHAIVDKVPQVIPHMMLSVAFTWLMDPVSNDSFKQAAVSGSTPITMAAGVPPRSLVALLKCCVTACAIEPHPTGTTACVAGLPPVAARTCPSTSSSIV